MKLGRMLGGAAVAAVGAIAVHDLTQKKHTLKRNFPVIANARYLIERIGPELRQYVVAGNDEERPFSRNQRSWVYASAKGENNYAGFGTDNDIEHLQGRAHIKHRNFSDKLPDASDQLATLPSAKVLGGPRGRKRAFRPNSVINISAMSFGSLSGPAVAAMNKGAAKAQVLHNTGEGGLTSYHRHGADLIFQIGTGYFGCRDERGAFDLGKLKEVVESAPVKAIEIKLSQGAKPGMGGLLPAPKVTQEIADIRGIPVGKDCASPSRHAAFDDVDEMLDFVELIAAETGMPVGIKSAIGSLDMWEELASLMAARDRGVDFITVDGGEGGTGAGPLSFSDAISLPYRMAFTRVYRKFAEQGLTDDVTFIGSAKLGLPENGAVAFALGADLVHVAREAMMAIGCIQAQKCHTDHCPVGIATQDPRYVFGLDIPDKAERCAQYLIHFRKELMKVSAAVGVAHPSMIAPEDVEIFNGDYESQTLSEIYGYNEGWGQLSPKLRDEIESIVETSSSFDETAAM